MPKKSINLILKEQIDLVKPDKKSINELNKLTKEFIGILNDEFSSVKVNAEAFVGGSFAKNTLIKENSTYDVDIFVRFDYRYDNISDMLENVLNKVCKKLNLVLEKVHGSRDYFKVHKDNLSYFEIIPVTKIKKPGEARNVTDLSYFHVPYVKRKLKGLEDQVRLAKLFFRAQRVYGAETYVRGFSGYALELLIIYYGSFLKMLRELVKVKKGDRLVIDIEKKYKRRNEVFIELNEARLHSPIILIDPTYKERNATAALSQETFDNFVESAKKFLKNPSSKFFVKSEIDVESMGKKAVRKKAEFVSIEISTDRQEGDIAGTKMKKFYEFLIFEISRYFSVIDKEFDYSGGGKSNAYFVLKKKNEIVRIGPPIHMKKHVSAFKKEHAKTYEKNKMIHAKLKINFDAWSYIDSWAKANPLKLKDMGITNLKVSHN